MRKLIAIGIAGAALAAPASAMAANGGSAYDPSAPSTSATRPVIAGSKAKIRNGKAYAPANAPEPIKKLIWAGNRIQNKPYVYGGGHAGYRLDRGYDCSGSVSYVLYHAGLLRGWPRVAPGFYTWGDPGEGRWLTVYANGGHTFLEVAGIRLDTSRVNDPGGESGPRWRPEMRDTGSFRAMSWPGL